MYVKSIELDGFKSYGRTTTVGPFDSQFNAITGLNGSGKSNILDAICFVLGISDLSRVRAKSLQDLVFKAGQGGISRANVTITFDNRDKARGACPLGYDTFDELVVTRQVAVEGRNKYLINGVAAQNKKVMDLFHSVSINVNNPHFLIMQGRVTKVLNMKPTELLGMLEEAVGTRMYDSKKQHAMKQIEKKKEKLRETELLLDESIGPRIAKLRSQQAAFLDFQRIEEEFKKLNRLLMAWQYTDYQKDEQRCTAKVDEAVKELAALSDRLKEIGCEIGECGQRIGAMKEAAKKTPEQESLEKQVKKCGDEVEKIGLEKVRVQDSIETEERMLAESANQREADRKLCEGRKAELETVMCENEEIFVTYETSKKDHEAAAKQLEDLRCGLADQGEQSTRNKLAKANGDKAAVDSDVRQAEADVKEWEVRMRSQQAQLKKTQSNDALMAKKNDLMKEIDKVTSSLQRDGVSESLENEYSELRRNLVASKKERDAFDTRYAALNVPGVDGVNIFGCVAKLFRLKDEIWATALQEAIGGALYQVVVSTNIIGAEMLKRQRGNSRRLTILPLNKLVVGHGQITEAMLRDVRRSLGAGGEEKVFRAIDLVEFDSNVEKAMQYVLGQIYVCSDKETAMRATYKMGQNSRMSVAMDGTVLRQGGEIAGGFDRNASTVLADLMKFHLANDFVRANSGRVAEMEELISRSADKMQKLRQLEEELKATTKALETTTYAKLVESIKEFEAKIDEAKKVIGEGAEKRAKLNDEIKELSWAMENVDQINEKAKKDAVTEVARSKKVMQKYEKRYSDGKRRVDVLKDQLEKMASLDGVGDNAGAAESRLNEHRAALNGVVERENAAKDALADANTRLQEICDAQRSKQREIEATDKQIKKLEKEKNKCEVKEKEKEVERKEAVCEVERYTRLIEKRTQDQPWIEQDREMFGVAGSDYDFSLHNRNGVERNLDELKAKRKKHSDQFGGNLKSATLFSNSIESEFKSITKKREIILKDLAKIYQTISDLDKRKDETLRNVHAKVTADFSDIFSSLLPNAEAKLHPIEADDEERGQRVMAGMEFKVAFSGEWKEQLSELSGGQRSLLALSLILALLRYNPAPFYILDEVDAALDVSHTLNIGRMIKKHFADSQFIIVSLKEGMFNNANVLFRTRFIDGVSNVSREQCSGTAPPAATNDNHNGAAPGRAKKKKARKPLKQVK